MRFASVTRLALWQLYREFVRIRAVQRLLHSADLCRQQPSGYAFLGRKDASAHADS
jgi:hypothetical protein